MSQASRVSARRPPHFSLLRQRKVSKRKASRMRRPFAALRVPCAARSRREAQKLGPAALRHLSLFIRRLLRCSALPQRRGSGHPFLRAPVAARPPLLVLAPDKVQVQRRCAPPGFRPPAVMRRRVAQGRADQGARMSEPKGRVCAHPARREQRSVPVAQRRDDASGSPFFCLLFFGDAKKSESAAGARPGLHPATPPAGARPGLHT